MESINREARRLSLQDRLAEIYNAIAEDAGANIEYTESINGSVFPSVVAVAAGDFEDSNRENCFNDCRFLAENNFILPSSLAKASEKEIEDYTHNNEDDILNAVEENAEFDYKSRFN